MKYWNNNKNTINLKSDNKLCNNRVLSISKFKNDEIMFIEQCDKFFAIIHTKQDAIKVLEEAIEFIKKEN